jgi:hypothetical protein
MRAAAQETGFSVCSSQASTVVRSHCGSDIARRNAAQLPSLRIQGAVHRVRPRRREEK